MGNNGSPKLVSIIIVNFRSEALIQRLMEDIEKFFERASVEVIISNNDKAFQPWTQSCSIDVSIINNQRNLGFGRAINSAAQNARGEFLFFINPDIRVLDFNFRSFIETLSRPDVGVLAPAVVYPNGDPQPNGGSRTTIMGLTLSLLHVGPFIRITKFHHLLRARIVSKILLSNSITHGYAKNYRPSGAPQEEFDWVSGAFLAIRKDLFQEIGGFDERFFMYFEDQDLCIRIRNLGYRILIDRATRVSHEVGASSPRSKIAPGIANLSKLISSVLFQEKNHNSTYLLILRCISAAYSTLLALVNALSGNFNHAGVWLRMSSLLLKKSGNLSSYNSDLL